MVKTRMHYQLPNQDVLCFNNNNFVKAVTNDVDSVTCPLCLNTIKRLGGEKVMEDKLRLKEILNRK